MRIVIISNITGSLVILFITFPEYFIPGRYISITQMTTNFINALQKINECINNNYIHLFFF